MCWGPRVWGQGLTIQVGTWSFTCNWTGALSSSNQKNNHKIVGYLLSWSFKSLYQKLKSVCSIVFSWNNFYSNCYWNKSQYLKEIAMQIWQVLKFVKAFYTSCKFNKNRTLIDKKFIVLKAEPWTFFLIFHYFQLK